VKRGETCEPLLHAMIERILKVLEFGTLWLLDVGPNKIERLLSYNARECPSTLLIPFKWRIDIK